MGILNKMNKKLQLEEAKKIEECLVEQLKEKTKICQSREVEIVSLRRKLEEETNNLNTSLKFDKISSNYDFINSQRSPFIKTNLGYNDKRKLVETGEGPC